MGQAAVWGAGMNWLDEYHQDWTVALWVGFQEAEEERELAELRKRGLKQRDSKIGRTPNVSIVVGRGASVAMGHHEVARDAIVDGSGRVVATVDDQLAFPDVPVMIADTLSKNLRSPYAWRLLHHILDVAWEQYLRNTRHSDDVVFQGGWRGVATAMDGNPGRHKEYKKAAYALAWARFGFGNMMSLHADRNGRERQITCTVGKALRLNWNLTQRGEARHTMPVCGNIALPHRDQWAAYAHYMAIGVAIRERAIEYTDEGIVLTAQERLALSPGLSERMETIVFDLFLGGGGNDELVRLEKTGRDRYRYADRRQHAAALESGEHAREGSRRRSRVHKSRRRKLGRG